jgi:hypothetical protein
VRRKDLHVSAWITTYIIVVQSLLSFLLRGYLLLLFYLVVHISILSAYPSLSLYLARYLYIVAIWRE